MMSVEMVGPSCHQQHSHVP